MTDVALVETVDVGRVDQRDAGVERGVEHPDALRLGRPAVDGEMHAAVADRRDGRRGGPERPCLTPRASKRAAEKGRQLDPRGEQVAGEQTKAVAGGRILVGQHGERGRCAGPAPVR